MVVGASSNRVTLSESDAGLRSSHADAAHRPSDRRTLHEGEGSSAAKRRTSTAIGGPRRSSKVGLGGGTSSSSRAGPKAIVTKTDAESFQSFAKTMHASAQKITQEVGSLYKKEQPGDGDSQPGSPKAPGSKGRASMAAKGDGDPAKRGSMHQGIADDGGEGRGSSGSSDSDSSKDGRAEQDEHESSEDDYDFKQSATKVTTLLDSLNCDARLEIMGSLNTFYNSRKAEVEDGLKELGSLEEEFQGREEETKHSMHTMLAAFEDKQMKEVKVLVKCNKTLSLGASNKLKTRRLFAKGSTKQSSKAKKSKKTMFAGDDDEEENEENEDQPSDEDKPKKSTEKSKARQARAAARKAKKQKSQQEGWNLEDDEEDEDGDEEDGDGGKGSDHESDEGEEDGDAAGAKATGAKSGLNLERGTVLEGLDVDGARRKLKEMHDIPAKVLAMIHLDDPPAGEILEAMAYVQEGQVELEKQAKLAAKACELSKAALESLVASAAGQSTAGASAAQPADGAVAQLIAEVRVGIFGANGEALPTGPDPEELEEECKMLEGMIAKQETDIEVCKKQRDRALKADQGTEGANKDEDAKSDGSEEEIEAKPRMFKSELRDGRIEAAQAAAATQLKRTESELAAKSDSAGKSALNRVASKLKVQRIVQQFTGVEGDPTADSTQKVPVSPTNAPAASPRNEKSNEKAVAAMQSNRDVQNLQERITEKEVKITKAREVHQRMKKEFAMLRYCAKKSDAGLEAILDSFNTEDAGGDSESSYESSDEEVAKKTKKGQDGKAKKRATVTQDSAFASEEGEDSDPEGQGADSDKKKKKDGAKKSRKSIAAPAKASSAKMKRSNTMEKAGVPSATADKNRKMDYASFQGQISTFNTRKLEEAEEDMKSRIEDLQNEITEDVALIKSEKKKQAALKKDMKKLKKNYKSMVKAHKGAPTSVEALDKQLRMLADGESKLQWQVEELTQELTKQQALLEKAQGEAKEAEERRLRQQGAATASPGQTMESLPSVDGSPAGAGADIASAERDGAGAVAAAPASALAGAIAPIADGRAGGVRFSEVATVAAGGKVGGVRFAEAEAPSVTAVPSTTDGAVPSAHKAKLAAAHTHVSFGIPAADEDTASATVATLSTAAKAPTVAKKSFADTMAEKKAAEKEKEKVDSRPSVNHEDLAELVRLQTHNEDIKAEIDEMMNKMQQLRTAMKRGRSDVLNNDSIKQIVGGPLTAEEQKPPPEYQSLKKEVRSKQNEVRGLRKRWWTDHKDLDSLAEKVKHHLHESGGSHHYDSQGHAQDKQRDAQPIVAQSLATNMSKTMSHKDHTQMPANWSANSRRTQHFGHQSTEHHDPFGHDAGDFEGTMISGSHINAQEHKAEPRTFQKSRTGVDALMASTTHFSASRDLKRRQSTHTSLGAQSSENLGEGMTMDATGSIGPAISEGGVRGRYGNVRKSLALAQHSIKDLIRDEEVDMHDRTVHESDTHRAPMAHPLAQEPEDTMHRRKTAKGILYPAQTFKQPVDLRRSKTDIY